MSRALVVFAWFLVACGSSGACTRAELESALGSARAGSTVTIGPCEIAGAFTVPGGVSVRGTGASTRLRSVEGDAPVLDIQTGTSSVEQLTISEEHGAFGLRALGAGMLQLRDVRVEVVRGVGVAVRERSFDADRLELSGPITAENAPTAPAMQSATGTFGLVVRSASSRLGAVHARGFAVCALAFADGSVTWIDPDADSDVLRTRGVGLGVFGATADLQGVELGEMIAGVGYPGVAFAVSGSTDTSASDVAIVNGDGYGIFVDGSNLVLDNARVQGLGLPGIQVQDGTLDARDLTMSGNGGVGILALNASSVALERSSIATTRMLSLPTERGSAPFGDGIQLRRVSATDAPIDLALASVTLDANPRAGLVLDGAETTPARVELMDVTTSAETPGAFGAISQHPTLPSGWDMGVTRMGTTEAADISFTGSVDVAGLIMPPTVVAVPTL
jgi:hypothetical protein